MEKSRRLVAILFADIEGYTTMMQTDEKDALAKLRRYQSSLQILVKTHQGNIIKNYGDGSLCVFTSVLEAVTCALDLQLDLQGSDAVPVRIGVHLGDVTFEQNDVYGNAINLASRIESVGVPGSVLLSNDVRRKIKIHQNLQTRSLGKYKFKNVAEPMELFALTNQGLIVPKRSTLKANMQTQVKKYRKIYNLAGILILAIVGVYFFIGKGQSELVKEKVVHKAILNNSIAVLPLSNLSTENDNKYFADGLHEDLISQISKVSAFRIISRTSVMRFRNTTMKISDIARELGVANILEGSVRRAGDQVRINVQLINAKTDESIWSKVFDRKLTTDNIFDLQSEITQSIANTLKTQISAKQLDILKERPTGNLEAYETFLKGRQLASKRNASALFEAKVLFEKCIALDPNFAQAYIQLGTVHHLMISYAEGDKKVNRSLAKKYLNKGLSLNENQAEAYALKAIIHENMEEYELAEEAFEKAMDINPNLPQIYHWYGLFHRDRTRDLDKAIAMFEQAKLLNPLSPTINFALGRIHIARGEFDEGKHYLLKTIDLEPSYPSSYLFMTLCYLVEEKLDSAVYLAVQNVETNGKQGIYFEHYLFPLWYLSMDEELREAHAQFIPKTRQEKLIKYRSRVNSSIYLDNDLDKALSLVSGEDIGTKEDIIYLKRDWPTLIREYETGHPLVINGEYQFEPTGNGANWDFFQFQRYIIALYKTGDSVKADQLWESYALQTSLSGDIEMRWGERIWNNYVILRHEAVNDNITEAMRLFKNFKTEKAFAWLWRWLDQDPALDSIRDHPDYERIMQDWKLEVAKQRENVRETIKLKK